MGARLVDGAEMLFRQIHPDLIQDGEPASSAFRPKEADENMLSVDRSALTTPQGAFDLYTANGFTSAAVYGVSVGEFETNGIACEEDPLVATDQLAANPAHALASFNGYGSNKQKTLAKRIKLAAVARGLLHPKTGESETDEVTE